jgi:transposase
MGPHQRVMLESHLRHLDFLDQEIQQMDEEVDSRMAPFEEAIHRIDAIPGVGRRTAQVKRYWPRPE